jgi:hypothetical protein
MDIVAVLGPRHQVQQPHSYSTESFPKPLFLPLVAIGPLHPKLWNHPAVGQGAIFIREPGVESAGSMKIRADSLLLSEQPVALIHHTWI